MKTSGELPPASCDRVRIRQVILNLLSNAARFTEHGGISVSLFRRGQAVRISVADTGPGVSPEDAQRIFEPFWQASDDHWRAAAGTGLGLSICQQFVELHGGRIWLESEVGRGTTFFVEFPLSGPVAHTAPASGWMREDWMWHERLFKGGQVATTERLTRPRVVVHDATGTLSPHLLRRTDQAEIVLAASASQVLPHLDACPTHVAILAEPDLDRLLPLLAEVERGAPETVVVGCLVPLPPERAAGFPLMGQLPKPVSRTDLEHALQAAGPVRRVLVVDDDPDLLRLLTRMLLTCDHSLHVETAASGAEALERLHSDPPDLVLLDIVMPGLSGWDVLAAMQEQQLAPGCRVFLVSAQDTAEVPPKGQLLVASAQGGFSVSKLLRCSLQISATLWAPD